MPSGELNSEPAVQDISSKFNLELYLPLAGSLARFLSWFCLEEWIFTSSALTLMGTAENEYNRKVSELLRCILRRSSFAD